MNKAKIQYVNIQLNIYNELEQLEYHCIATNLYYRYFRHVLPKSSFMIPLLNKINI